MDWITGLQNAIDYVEAHLTEELDYAEVARRAYSSSFHFQRVFSILCGYSLGDYIRCRRLTLAGKALSTTELRVIDAAMQFGYDSPESFGRAFTRFHGITPSQAKRGGAPLKSFSRLSVKLSLDGGSIMNYKIEKREAIRVLMKKENFPTAQELCKPKMVAFWGACTQDGTIETLCAHAQENGPFGDMVVGVCFENAAKDGVFPYGIGVACGRGAAPEGFEIVTLPESTWAMFECVGAMPDAFMNLQKTVYTDFFPTSEYQPCGILDLELYPSAKVDDPNYRCEFWIAVEKK